MIVKRGVNEYTNVMLESVCAIMYEMWSDESAIRCKVDTDDLGIVNKNLVLLVQSADIVMVVYTGVNIEMIA